MKTKLKSPLYTLIIFVPMLIISGFYMHQSHPVVNGNGTIQLSYNQQQFNKVDSTMTMLNSSHLV
jgi:hypothetical protein